MRWTDERLATLRQLHDEGNTAGEIAGLLGAPYVTRNAVIGKLHRLGLHRAPVVRIKVKRSRTPKSAPKVDLKRRPEPVAPVAASRPVNISGLHAAHCRWPPWSLEERDTDRQMYCGGVSSAGPYCEQHAAKAAGKHYTPTEGLAYRMAAARAQKARLHSRLKIGVGA